MASRLRLLLTAQALLLSAQLCAGHPAQGAAEQPSWQVFRSLGEKAQTQQNWHKAQQLYSVALHEAESAGAQKELPALLSSLANSYCQIDELDKAQPLYERAFNILRNTGAPTNEIAQAMLSLAAVYESQGKHSKAEPLYKNVLSGNFGNSIQLGQGLHKLGMAYYKRGQIHKSKQLLSRASAVLDGVDRNSPVALECRADLQMVDRKPAPVPVAAPQAVLPPPLVRIDANPSGSSLDNATDSNQQQAGQNDTNEAGKIVDNDPSLPLNPLFSTLTDVFYKQRRFAAAEPLYKKIISIDETTLGPEYPATGYDVNNLALLYLSEGRIKEATPLLERALHIFQKNYGQDNLAVVRCQANLASVYTHAGQFESAKTLLDVALSSSNKLLGENSFESGSILNKLGYLFYKQGQFEQASGYFAKAVKTLQGTSGASGKMIAASLTDYARSLRAQNRTQEASEAEHEAQSLLTSKTSN
jgi:tetratricopeptide (TPR) repeat protein